MSEAYYDIITVPQQQMSYATLVKNLTANSYYHINHLKMDLDPCRYCPYVGDDHSTTSSHIHTNHPGKRLYQSFLLDLWTDV